MIRQKHLDALENAMSCVEKHAITTSHPAFALLCDLEETATAEEIAKVETVERVRAWMRRDWRYYGH